MCCSRSSRCRGSGSSLSAGRHLCIACVLTHMYLHALYVIEDTQVTLIPRLIHYTRSFPYILSPLMLRDLQQNVVHLQRTFTQGINTKYCAVDRTCTLGIN